MNRGTWQDFCEHNYVGNLRYTTHHQNGGGVIEICDENVDKSSKIANVRQYDPSKDTPKGYIQTCKAPSQIGAVLVEVQ